MELLQLQYFQTVARLENITQAARELYISQPCLSRSISRLEQDLGVSLFDRKGRNILLNSYGKAFLRHVNAALKELSEGRQEVTDMVTQFRETVSIGAVTLRFLPHFFNQFLHCNGNVKFRLINAKPHGEIEKDLQEGVIDLAFTFTPIAGNEIECTLLTEEEILLAVPQNHFLANKDCISLSAAACEPFISLIDDLDFSELSKSLCQQAGFTPDIRFESPTADIIASLVAEGFGCALFPESWRSTVKLDGISFVHINAPRGYRSIYASRNKRCQQSPAAAGFLRFITDFFAGGGSVR